MYEIEDGVPLPYNVGGRPRLYPWADLKVGQSFFVPDGVANRRVMSACARGWAKRHGGKFITRKCEKDGVPGTRVWRIE